MAQPVRVLIADDHHRSRLGLRALLTTSSAIKVVGEAADGQEAVNLVEDCKPHVVLLDDRMPVMNGLEAGCHIKKSWPDIRVVILTMSHAGRVEALPTCIDGLLLKGCPLDKLWQAILGSR
jgi:DNA-binding NarL/FixJ family response regulator